jgi:PAS domain S-box-containing protein
MDDQARHLTLDAVLRVAARHPNLLDEEAFEDLAEVLAGPAQGARVTVMVPDGQLWFRIYAVSSGPEPALGFGERVPGVEQDWRTLAVEGKPIFCDDMRVGNEVERAAVQSGALSYVAFPCRVTAPRPRAMRRPSDAPEEAARVAALLVFTFPGAGEVRRVDAAQLQEIADTIGPALERAAHLSREHRLAMILETSADAMLAWDRQGRVTDANTAAAVLAGRPRGELLGTPIAELLDPVPRAATHAVTEGARLALLSRSPAGLRRVTVAVTVTSVEHDALVATHALLRDLTQVVRAEREAALRLARIHVLEEQHRTLLDNAPLIIFRLDPASGELVYLNRHAERLLGVPTAEALGTPGFLRGAHADPDGALAFDRALAEAAGGAPSHPYEARLTRRGGDEITVRGIVYPLLAKGLAEGGGVAAIEGVLADVSAEHAARTRLVQADRLSTLGTLAAGVAHEINNPAAFILLGLDLLDRLLSGEGVELESSVAANARETLFELRDSIRRIVDIARDLRLFASPPAPDGGRRSIVDVNRTVESALSLTRGQILERALVERHLEEVPPVLMDDGRLGQVVVNLLVNAAHAIPKSYGGDHRVTVATRSDGHTVEIEVSDTGVGIPEENMARIWQPFFTTKSPDVGTGLGLSISREIVERAGGTITVESPARPTSPTSPIPDGAAGGARFVIHLPAAGRSEEIPPPPPSPLPVFEAPPARVLIVEDEPALARALAEEIGRRHEVVLVGGAEAALVRLGEQPFDVVLCDLRMPGLSGEALYARVLEQDPEQAEGFVFMTGVGFGAEVERFLGESGRPVLEKPFPATQALEAIARVRKRRGVS